MTKSLWVGVALGAVGATAGGAFATYDFASSEPQSAKVVAVQPIREYVSTPREVCRDVAVTQARSVQDEHKILGTALGALAGGLLGNQLGNGSGQKIATIAGAVAGGYAGNRVQEEMQNRDIYTTQEPRCSTVTDTEERVTGYNVSYQMNGQIYQVRMDHDPGQQLPLQNGQPVLNAPSDQSGSLAVPSTQFSAPAGSAVPSSMPMQGHSI